ncbi:hypothetical protein [Hippea alviniae]|uniref:hypothetical protein n=1 Tax=Hippea alviniae TaxID=1279027 RepID=UPI0003B42122|nr:hypothetical protein [Hippea alviniae]
MLIGITQKTKHTIKSNKQLRDKIMKEVKDKRNKKQNNYILALDFSEANYIQYSICKNT